MKKFGTDKILHFLAGMVICLVVISLGKLAFPEEQVMAYGIGLACTLLAGIAKELYDGWDKADQWDFAATLIGGVIGAVLLGIIDIL